MNGIEQITINEALYFYKDTLNKSLERIHIKKNRWNKKAQDIFKKFGKNSLYFELITAAKDFTIQEKVLKAKLNIINKKLKKL
ncbi:hypothetical protein [Fusobacterium sp. MFO224]|uniref:hypothetical protein n=1 Tax=Fusobacterium sp. MFO224 TaxID=3378070 RepID=UPI003852FE77